ncbi:MAG: TldD/PmbA family protein [Oscillospiraceae bacterium]|jgi:PmbA protein|nr:TldD/PmbA family protein [Oscillospiraceae bacterium]
MKTNREIAAYALGELKKAGADSAQCTVSQGKGDELNVDGGEFSLMRSLFTSSISLKAIKGGKKGVAGTNRIDKEAVDEAVRSCILSAEGSVEDPAEYISPDQGIHSFTAGAAAGDNGKLFDRIDGYMKAVKAEYPKIVLEQLISSYSASERLYMNTNGTELTFKFGLYGFESMFSAHEGEKASSFNGYGVKTDNLDSDFMDMGMMRQLLGESERQLDTKPVDGKFVGTLVITPACTLDLLGSLLRNCVTDTVLIDGTSPWKDKLGQKVADSKLTVSSNPLDPRICDGERVTADGYVSEDYDILRDGVLTSFSLSQYGAKKSGNLRAKNTSFSIVIAEGDKSVDEIIASVDKGVLLGRFSGGSPETNGDFSGVAKNSFLIENGKLCGALSETMISGNLLDMVNNVQAVSRETVCDGASVLPWIAFGGITVSGK